MNVLILHNYYKLAGGEDTVVQAEAALLRGSGHTVHIHSVDNKTIEGPRGKMSAAANLVYSNSAKRAVSEVIREIRPDIVHVHNWFPLLSPSVYDACNDARVPVVQTLHNYRLACPNAMLFNKGQVCEKCVGKLVPWPAITDKCYRGSLVESTGVAFMLGVHNLRNTWRSKVDQYIALTQFQKRKMVESGIPEPLISVKPNFVRNDAFPEVTIREDHAIFVGRLSEEKGILPVVKSLLSSQRQINLKIAGDGPLMEELRNITKDSPNIELLGRLDPPRVREEMLKAKVLIFPSKWYEGLPMTILESYSCGLPVVVPQLGSLSEVVTDGYNGKTVPPNDIEGLLDAAESVLSNESWGNLSKNARAEYESMYSDTINCEVIIDIYRNTIANYSR